MLNSEEVRGRRLKSTSLGKNLEDIQQFLRDISSQMGLPSFNCTTTVSSKVNVIDLKMAYPVRDVHLYDAGLLQLMQE